MQIKDEGGPLQEVAVGGGTSIVALVLIGAASQSSRAAPIIAGVVALAVALITWYATDKRQAKALVAEERRQSQALSAEQERHEATLAAESARLETQLAHERNIRDLEHGRQLLAPILARAVDSATALSELRAVTESYVEEPDEGQEERQRGAFTAARTCLDGVEKDYYPVALVFGASDEVAERLADVIVAMRDVVRELTTVKGITAENLAAAKTADEQHTASLARFIAATSERLRWKPIIEAA